MKIVMVMTMCVAMVALASVAQADLVLTTATGTGADSYVRNSDTSNFGTVDTMMLLDGSGLSYDRVAYMRFDLSTLNFTVDSATIAVTQPTGSATYWRTYLSVYALDESATGYGTGKLGEDWGETSINGDNAPGANNANNNLIDPNYTTLLGTIARPASLPALTSLTFSTNLECFNNDTNDMVTLIMVQSYPNYTSLIATKEHATLAAPTLTLTPEPATMTLLLLGLPLALRRRRK
ncbi:MAG: hypothetical protein K8S55_11565 [Phycisphaerae bacterium]|nr:hypothetical protein [Phycisphaerae bacterium]